LKKIFNKFFFFSPVRFYLETLATLDTAARNEFFAIRSRAENSLIDLIPSALHKTVTGGVPEELERENSIRREARRAAEDGGKFFFPEFLQNYFLMKEIFDYEKNNLNQNNNNNNNNNNQHYPVQQEISSENSSSPPPTRSPPHNNNNNNNNKNNHHYYNLWESDNLSKSLSESTRELSKSQWEKDDSCAACRKCQRNFHPVTLRKHHCRQCGQIYCSDCSARKLPLPKIGFPFPVRVCDSCQEEVTRVKWVSDADAPECKICHVTFDRFYNRRHHCRQCGHVVCGTCSGHQLPIVGSPGGEPGGGSPVMTNDDVMGGSHRYASHVMVERVCDECFVKLTKVKWVKDEQVNHCKRCLSGFTWANRKVKKKKKKKIFFFLF
jgi:hypothetical protein